MLQKSDHLRRLNEVMDLKLSLLIFKQFHGAVTRSQKKCLCTFVRQCFDDFFFGKVGFVTCNKPFDLG